MIRLEKNHGYETSRDYSLLVELMQKTAVICFIDHNWPVGEITRDIAATVYRTTDIGNEVFDISCRGTSYCYSFGCQQFVECCQKYNVEFIIPVFYEQCEDCGSKIPAEHFKNHQCGD